MTQWVAISRRAHAQAAPTNLKCMPRNRRKSLLTLSSLHLHQALRKGVVLTIRSSRQLSWKSWRGDTGCAWLEGISRRQFERRCRLKYLLRRVMKMKRRRRKAIACDPRDEMNLWLESGSQRSTRPCCKTTTPWTPTWRTYAKSTSEREKRESEWPLFKANLH